MAVIVFEDDQVGDLTPITLARPAYRVLCGGFRLLDWLAKLDQPCMFLVRDYLGLIEHADGRPMYQATNADRESPTCWINARLVPSHTTYLALREMLDAPTPGIVANGDAIAAVVLPPEAPSPPDNLTTARLSQYFRDAGVAELPQLEMDLPLFEYPHDVIRQNQTILNENLEYLLKTGDYHEVADGVYAADGARLDSYVVTDTRQGPIVLQQNVVIGPFVLLSGPAWLGANTRVIEHAAIKDAVTIGHAAKIGGEVEASVIESHTNKQHHGFLGHSYLGGWINLGAGTCNSDLKNTYGEVNMKYQGRRVATGMQFVGCVMGDYAKTAINTGIFTGKTIGVCSMLYGFVTSNVPSFVNYARLFGQMTELPADVMIATQRRMFQRRDVPQRPCDEQLIRDMHAITAAEREAITSTDALAL